MMDTECKGLTFRAFSNLFVSDYKIEERRGFRLLKRKSCMGCRDCYGLIEHVLETLRDYDWLPVDTEIDIWKEYTVSVNGSDGEEILFIKGSE